MDNFETVTASEREYFNSKGEKPIPTGDEAPVETESDEVEVAEPDEVEASADDDVDEVEVKEETKAEEEKPKAKDQRIPLRKLQESENQRKELAAKLAEREQAFARADERLRMLLEAQQPKQEAAPPPPDPREDPIGAIEYQRQQMEAFQQAQARAAQEYQQQQQLNAIDTNYRQSWGQFANSTPDAIDAYNHFVNVTGKFLAMQGIPQERVNQLIENEERKIAYTAMQSGQNPAELIYNAAREMGYMPKAVEAPVVDEVAKRADADIDRRQKAASASKSIGSASGSRAGAMPSFEELANMPDDEYEEFRAKVGERKLRKIMGG